MTLPQEIIPAGQQNADEFYARTYDDSVPDWPGEMDFYQELTAEAKRWGQTVLEVACGTGRVAIRLAQKGVNVVGLDLKRHLCPGGTLVVHLDPPDVSWLGDLRRGKGGVFEVKEQFQHPFTGRPVCALRAWSYEPFTQTAIEQTVWEERDAEGQVVNRVERKPIRLHCVFRFEMEHLLARVGLEVEAVYGNFFRQELQDESSDMIWVAKKGDTSCDP